MSESRAPTFIQRVQIICNQRDTLIVTPEILAEAGPMTLEEAKLFLDSMSQLRAIAMGIPA